MKLSNIEKSIINTIVDFDDFADCNCFDTAWGIGESPLCHEKITQTGLIQICDLMVSKGLLYSSSINDDGENYEFHNCHYTFCYGLTKKGLNFVDKNHINYDMLYNAIVNC